MFSHLFKSPAVWNPSDWDLSGATFDGDLLITDTDAGENNFARSKWYLTGDFIIEAKVTITNRGTGKHHRSNMWISRESDNVCFATHRSWGPDGVSGFLPQWRGWDSCSLTTGMGAYGEQTNTNLVAISRITRVGSRIRTYVKHDGQVGFPDNAFTLTGDDTSFVSGVPGNANCNVSLGARSYTPDTPTAEVAWHYLSVVSGTQVWP